MFNKPLYAERHVQWCERSENEIGGNYFIFLLLDSTKPQLSQAKKFVISAHLKILGDSVKMTIFAS